MFEECVAVQINLGRAGSREGQAAGKGRLQTGQTDRQAQAMSLGHEISGGAL